MDIILSYLSDHKEVIIEGIIITLSGGVLMSLLSKFGGYVKNKFFHKDLPISDEKAVLLSSPQTRLDNCFERNTLFENVHNQITDASPSSEKKHIMITGEEGIGKTLFCHTIYNSLKTKKYYLGWIDCNGFQSVFDIIKSTFKDSRFYKKNKNKILEAFENLDRPCILFIDRVDQNVPLEDLEALSTCSNVILVISGVLKKINFIDILFELPSLSEKIIYKIFGNKLEKPIDEMAYAEQSKIKDLLDFYAKGNPFLAIAFAEAGPFYNNRWEDIIEHLEKREYDDEHYLKYILKQLYKINELDINDKNTLSKLSIISCKSFGKAVFTWLSISEDCINRLSNTYWIKREDNILYSIDEIRKKALEKVLSFQENIQNTIDSISGSLSVWDSNKDNGFQWIAFYVEDILHQIQRNAPQLMTEDPFYYFALEVAAKYMILDNKEKFLDWIELSDPKEPNAAFVKAYLHFYAKCFFYNKRFSALDIEEAFSNTKEKARKLEDHKYLERNLKAQYCWFLINTMQYSDAILLCKEYFNTYDIDLTCEANCNMYYCYLSAANQTNNEEVLEILINEKNIQSLYQNDEVSICVAFCFKELTVIYRKRNNKELSEKYKRHAVVLLNKQRGFFHKELKNFLKISDEEFAEYMHSCDELLNSLNEALDSEDAEALYIEGRYQEKHGNFEKAFELYERASARDSLRGMCSLAVLYYRGQVEPQNFDKARKYWEYCCERGHRGSHYWLGILLLDKEYKDYNKKSALEELQKAAESGSERAKQKLLECST